MAFCCAISAAFSVLLCSARCKQAVYSAISFGVRQIRLHVMKWKLAIYSTPEILRGLHRDLFRLL